MKLLKMEVHLFRTHVDNPASKDFRKFFEIFEHLELVPHYIEELNKVTGATQKRFQLFNQLKNQTVTFFTDKIHISQDFLPNAEDSSPEKFLEFVDGVVDCLESCIDFELKNNRISLVKTLFTDANPDIRNSAASKVAGLILGDQGEYTEVKTRLGSLVHNDKLNEKINCVLSLNDGYLEQGNNDGVHRTECFICQLDINTLSEVKAERIHMKDTTDIISSFEELAQEKSKKVEDFIKGA
jgi:hypothetical protein